jgi:hypothetical protein
VTIQPLQTPLVHLIVERPLGEMRSGHQLTG